MDAKLEVEDARDDGRPTSASAAGGRELLLRLLEDAPSARHLLDAADILDAGIASRLREIMAPLNRDPDLDLDLDHLPPLDTRSLRSFLLFCCRAGSALDARFSPGRDDEGLLGAQFWRDGRGTLSIDFRETGEAWLAWVNGSGRRGSCRCPAGDLLTPLDPVMVERWFA